VGVQTALVAVVQARTKLKQEGMVQRETLRLAQEEQTANNINKRAITCLAPQWFLLRSSYSSNGPRGSIARWHLCMF
jgi:hypothetical protein